MRIASARVQRLELELREPYAIAYQTVSRVTNFLLSLTDEDGIEAQGCAAPAVDVTGEETDACAAALARIVERIPGSSPAAADDPAIAPLLRGLPAAAAALDMALLELRARRAGVLLCELLGAAPAARLTSVTLGIDEVEATVEAGRARVAEGFKALKVKGGLEVDGDLERLARLREAVGPHIELRFDANQGYAAEEAIRFGERCAPIGISLYEQPVAAADVESLARITAALRSRRKTLPSIPRLLADEAVLGPDDARELARRGAADGFVIKLMKAGGIHPALEIDAVAHRHGLLCMISCMDELELGIAAAHHTALAAQTVRWVDLDGHLDLLDDPTAGLLELREGALAATGSRGRAAR